MFRSSKNLTIQSVSDSVDERYSFEIVRLFESRFDRNDMERALVAHPSHVFFALSGKAVVGVAASLPDQDGYEAVLLCYVVPRWRRRGLGTALVRRSIQSLHRGSELPYYLAFYPHEDHTAPLFLRRFGLNYLFSDIGMSYEGGYLPVSPEAQIVTYEDRFYEEMVRLRNFGVAEDQALKSLEARPLFSEDDQLYRSWMKAHADQAFVLLQDGHCAGFTMAAADGEIRSVVVAPEARGHGYSRALVSRAVNYQIDHGKSSVYLWVAAKNTVARHIYESLGFQKDATFDCARGIPILEPEKDGSLLRSTALDS